MQSGSETLDLAIQAKDLRFSWATQLKPTLAIRNLEIRKRERVLLQGASGSGKTTLLGLLGGVLVPQEGEVKILGNTIFQMPAAARDIFRVTHIGFIFQMFNLLPYLSVIDNVLLPCFFSKKRHENATQKHSLKEEAELLLRTLNMGDPVIFQKRVGNLSVGQQQRVAVARALIGHPEIIIADEPTSALDEQIKEVFLDLLLQKCQENQMTVLFVSHDNSLASHFDRVIHMNELNPRADLA